MRPDEFEHKPLESLMRGIDEDHADPQLLKQSLLARGLDADKATDEVKKMVSDVLKARRLAWRDEAKKNQSIMEAVFSKVISWKNKTREEIEAAFAAATSTRQLNIAHRNLSQLTTDDKAMMLDEIEALQRMGRETPPPAGPKT